MSEFANGHRSLMSTPGEGHDYGNRSMNSTHDTFNENDVSDQQTRSFFQDFVSDYGHKKRDIEQCPKNAECRCQPEPDLQFFGVPYPHWGLLIPRMVARGTGVSNCRIVHSEDKHTESDHGRSQGRLDWSQRRPGDSTGVRGDLTGVEGDLRRKILALAIEDESALLQPTKEPLSLRLSSSSITLRTDEESSLLFKSYFCCFEDIMWCFKQTGIPNRTLFKLNFQELL
jgi:hypothetical protein